MATKDQLQKRMTLWWGCCSIVQCVCTKPILEMPPLTCQYAFDTDLPGLPVHIHDHMPWINAAEETLFSKSCSGDHYCDTEQEQKRPEQ